MTSERGIELGRRGMLLQQLVSRHCRWRPPMESSLRPLGALLAVS